VTKGTHLCGLTIRITGQTLTCHMVAVSTILAGALFKTVWSIRSNRTRMFTCEPNVTRTTHVLTSNMVTCSVSCRIKQFTKSTESNQTQSLVYRITWLQRNKKREFASGNVSI